MLSPDVPAHLLVTVVPERLARELRAHNQEHRPEHRVRLRMAMHTGDVVSDERGMGGKSLFEAFRLLDNGTLKHALAGSSAKVALLLSDRFYREVVQHDPDLAPAAYRAVTPRAGHIEMAARIRLLSDPLPDRPATDRDFDEFYLKNFRLVRNIVNSRALDWTLADGLEQAIEEAADRITGG